VKYLIFLFLTLNAFAADRKVDIGVAEYKQTTTPANPASGFNKSYIKSDGKLYTLTPAGAEKALLESPAVLTTDVSGTLPVANGGTGQSSYTNGQLLIGNSTGNTLTKASLTAGSGVTITPGAGTITIASSAGAGGTLVGTASWAGTANCAWSKSPNGSGFETYNVADSDCPTPTVTGDITAPGTKIPAIVVGTGSVSTTATYIFVATAGFWHTSAARYICAWRVTDGTNTGSIVPNYFNASSGTVGSGGWSSTFMFSSTGAKTVSIQVNNDDNSGACAINAANINSATGGLTIQLYKF
jgi:hypothetical protein